MGQQQLLLIILSVIVVGIAVAVGIALFKDNASQSNRDAVTNDLVDLAARAQQYYRRPSALGGGQGSFAGLTAIKMLTALPNGQNANGTYSISSPGPGTVQIIGVGVETGNDDALPVKIRMNVWPDSARATVLN